MIFLKNSQIDISEKRLPREGFLLIELMISLIVVIFFSYMLYCYLSILIATNYETLKRYEATHLIQSFLAQAIFDPTLLQQKNIYSKDGITLRWDFDAISIDLPAFLKNTINNTKYVTVYAEWMGPYKKKQSLAIKSGVMVSHYDK